MEMEKLHDGAGIAVVFTVQLEWINRYFYHSHICTVSLPHITSFIHNKIIVIVVAKSLNLFLLSICLEVSLSLKL